jgi:hypothetical protein
MELVPFSVINQYLKERLIHASRYSGEEISFLKIFQHGLSFNLTKQKHKVIKTYLSWPLQLQMLVYYLKSLRRKPNQAKPVFREFVILDPGRIMKGEDGQWHSIYFDKIAGIIGKEKLTIISTKPGSEIPKDHDISAFYTPLPFPDQREKAMLREILQAYSNAKECRQFTREELIQIKSALHIFYEEFRFYYHIFKDQPVKKLLFVCHYHNEGLIAAIKTLGIECIEVQHGLIATNDLYYVYHEQFAAVIGKSLFPEKILVYGPYWKRILEMGCEYHSFQIHIAGDYLYRLPDYSIKTHRKENIVLICAQKNLHRDYVMYAKKLALHLRNHPEWRGIVKLHPLEKNKEAYEELREHNLEIVDFEVPLDELMSKSKIQISIYSTTFYDAFGFDVVNFSLQDYGAMSDYASDMISEGVAEPLLADEDPIIRYQQLKESAHREFSREDVYSQFDENAIRRALGL